jgi:holliday junction DNA helicase RuvA
VDSFLVNRDFIRAPVFFFITPLFIALSIVFCSFGICALASSILPTSTIFLKSETASFIARLRRKLKTRFLSDCLCAFLAPFVIAICVRDFTLLVVEKQVTEYYDVDMISRLHGSVVHISDHHIVVDVGGVGYKVFATPTTIATLKEGKKITVATYMAVREDALDLYGFLEESEKHMFELLLSVSGIGPKSALTILSLAQANVLVSAISTGKATHLTNVSGIGKKTAEKIVLELRDKVKGLDAGSYNEGDEDTLEALCAMGYSAKEARAALQNVSEDAVGDSARLREALRILGGN